MTATRLIKRFRRAEDGASLIEYSIVIVLFLLIFFALLDFGRLGFNWVMTEKAMQRAARIAVTREPVCPGVPELHERGTNDAFSYGALCREDTGICANAGLQACVLSATPINCDAATASTADEIWCIINPILPSNATPQNIRVSYSFDQNLGFLGGPYTPMVEVAVVTQDDVPVIQDSVELRFDFITPLPGLAAIVGGGTPDNIADSGTDGQADIPFPDLSVSMPAEDLAQGNNG
ncbi:MAG: TadE/TadG family type IV pilus assembly protein [Pseudomonadota bacterium]